MDETIELLIINGCDSLIPSVLSTLEKGSYSINYWRANTKQETLETLHGDVLWDLILLDETQSEEWASTLKLVRHFNEDTPLVFIAESSLSKVAVPAMQNGADDCIPKTNLGQLLPVFKREHNHQVIKQKYHNAQNKADILGSIINNSSNEVFLFDSETFDCLYVNHPVLQNNGYTAQEITQLTPADIYADHNLTSFRELITPLLDDTLERIAVCTKIKHAKGDSYQAEIQLTLMDRDGHRFLLAINKDISYQQDKTQKLKRQHKLAVQYRLQNKQKADLLANAAHDMRTSLTSIILSNRLLSEREPGDSPSEIDSLTTAIHHSGNHLLEYISEFFDAPGKEINKEEIETELVDVTAFSNKLYHIFQPIAKSSDLSLVYDTSELAHDKITTNATYLKRILKNILSNAFKYTERGKVSLKVYSASETELAKTTLDTTQAIAFQVSDTGMGIPKSEQSKIFKRHSRTSTSKNNDFEGLGLGLHICKKLTEALGGTLELESSNDNGTTFVMYLSADCESNNKARKKKPQNESPCQPKKIDKTILVLDDSNIHNIAAKEFLSYSFSECFMATTKEKAYEIIDEESIDCFVLDYIINDTNSVEVANAIRKKKQYTNAPIIVYTGKILSEQEVDGIKEVANAIVKKTAGSYNTLVDTIHSCLNKPGTPTS